jgi:hypothetical protein
MNRIIQIQARNRKTGEVESLSIEGNEELPDFLHCFLAASSKIDPNTPAYMELKPTKQTYGEAFGVSNQWDSLSVQFTDIKQPEEKREIRKLNGVHHHTQHAACGIVLLASEVAVTCKESGISFSVRMQSTYKTNLEWLHPFSIASNVAIELRKCKAHGFFPHQRFSKNEISGMLITLLRSKGLLKAKDFVQANLYLMQASNATLSLLLDYVSSINSTVGMPSISLFDLRIASQAHDWILGENSGKPHAEVHLLNWKRDAEAAAAAFSRSKRVASSEWQAKPKSVKVFTDPTARQGKELALDKVEVRRLARVLKARYATNPEFSRKLTLLGNAILTFPSMAAERRKEIAKQIKASFPDSEANLIAQFISLAKTDKIEEDLLGFASEMEAGKPRQKVDLLSLIKKA